MKGWYGNRQQHGLASKGIKSRSLQSKGWFDSEEEYSEEEQTVNMMRLQEEIEERERQERERDIEEYNSRGIKTLPKNEVQTIFNFYYDAGHGWLKVPLNLIKHLGISKDISNYSYVKNGYIYLEEDSDASIFIEAYRNLYNIPKIIENYDGDESKIRDYKMYVADGVKKFTSNKWQKSFDISTVDGIEKAESFKTTLENKFDMVETKIIGVDEVLLIGQNTKHKDKKITVEKEYLGYNRDEVMHNAYMKAVDNIRDRNGNTDREINSEMKKVLKDNGYERYVELV